MPRRWLIVVAVLAAVVAVRPAAVVAATTATTRLRIERPLDLAALPLLVVQRQHRIERVAKAMGLGTVTVSWTAAGAARPLEALTAGKSDFAVVDLAHFLLAADATTGHGRAVRALAALMQRPYVLVTRNPAVHTILDFTSADRIAVPALHTSDPALLLEMAAAQEWGPRHYNRLDRLMVARSDAAAAAELMSGTGGITAHFSHSPYVGAELGSKGIRRVMDSFDIAGPHTTTVLVGTRRLCDAKRLLCEAVLSALQGADDFISQNRGAAAEIFAAATKNREIPVEVLSDMIGDPDLAYTAAPAGVMRRADFMLRIGQLKRRVAAWQELFLPEAHDLKGN